MKTLRIEFHRNLLAIFIAAPLLASCASVSQREVGTGNDALKSNNCSLAVESYTKAWQDGKDSVNSLGFSWGGLAAGRLGHMYADGNCVTQDRATARLWFERELAAAGSISNGPRDMACFNDPNSSQCAGNQMAGNQESYVPPPQGNPFQASNDIYAANLAAIQARQNQQYSSRTVVQPQAYSANQGSGGTGFTYDKGLDQCVTLGGDSQSAYFDNGCNASLTIIEFQKGYGSGELNCGPNSRCTFGIAGMGYTRREDFTYAVCPMGDYIEATPGNQWQGRGPFACRRP